MKIKEILQNQQGHSLLEVLASGVIMMILAFMMLRGFQISGNLLLRGNDLTKQMGEAQEQAEFGGADKTRDKILTFRAENGETARLNVREKIYEIGTEHGRTKKASWKLLEKRESK